MSENLHNPFGILLLSCLAALGGCDGDDGTTLPEVQDAADGSDVDAAPADAARLDDAATRDGAGAQEGCTRGVLAAMVDDYFEALSAHDASLLPLAAQAKLTENGEVIEAGEGLWATAGELKLTRSALDTMTCTSVTEGVLSEAGDDIVVGLRLKLEAGKITEVETIAVRSGDYISSPAGLLDTADDDWESTLPQDARPTRGQLAAVVDNYFIRFPEGVCGFAEDCMRYENGLATGACSATECSDAGVETGSRSMTPRLHVLDVEAGIAVGFTMFTSRVFAGTYTDFHMFKLRDGQVGGIHATLAGAEASGWE